MTLKKVI